MKKLSPAAPRKLPKRLAGAALTAVVGGAGTPPVPNPNQTAFYQPNINGIEEN